MLKPTSLCRPMDILPKTLQYTVGQSGGSPDEEPFLHDSLDRGSKMADEDPLGGGVALVFTAPADYGEGIAG